MRSSRDVDPLLGHSVLGEDLVVRGSPGLRIPAHEFSLGFAVLGNFPLTWVALLRSSSAVQLCTSTGSRPA